MVRKGVLVSINSDSAEHARRLNTEAAKSVKWGGLSDDEALALVTINPAKQLRIDNKVGLDRGRQGRRHRGLDAPPAQQLRDRRSRPTSTAFRYYDRLTEERRLTELRKEKSDLAAAERAATRPPTAAPQRPWRRGAGGEWPRSSCERVRCERHQRRQRRPARPASSPTAARGGHRCSAITNATIHPVTVATIERGTIVMRGGKIEAVGANVQVPSGAKVIDAPAATSIPASSTPARRSGLDEPGARGFDDVERDARLQPAPAHARRVSLRERRDPCCARQRHHDGGRRAVGGRLRRSGRGDEPRRLDLGRRDAQARTSASRSTSRRWLAAAGAAAVAAGVAAAAPAAIAPTRIVKRERDKRLDGIMRLFERARAYAKAGSDQHGRLDARSARASRRTQAAAHHERLPRAGHPRRDCVRRARERQHHPQRRDGCRRRRAAAEGEEHPGDPRAACSACLRARTCSMPTAISSPACSRRRA